MKGTTNVIGNLGASEILMGAKAREPMGPRSSSFVESRAAAPKDAPASFEEALGKADEPVETEARTDGEDEIDLTRFKKIDRSARSEGTPAAGRPIGAKPAPRSEPPEAAEKGPKADARAAAALGSAFFGVSAMRDNLAAASEASDESILALEDFRDSQAIAKQAAMQGFMAEMQEQFGASPKEIVQAFADLSPERLMGPPEGARDAFLNNLSLSGADRARAAELYDRMAQATQEAATNERLAGEQLNARFEVLTAGESRLRSLNHSLDRLNDSFFLRGQPGAGPFGRPMAAPGGPPAAGQGGAPTEDDLVAALQSARDRKAGGFAAAGALATAMAGAPNGNGAGVGSAASAMSASPNAAAAVPTQALAALAALAAQSQAQEDVGALADSFADEDDSLLIAGFESKGASPASQRSLAAAVDANAASIASLQPTNASLGAQAAAAAAAGKGAYAGAKKIEGAEAGAAGKKPSAEPKADAPAQAADLSADASSALVAGGAAPKAAAGAGAMFAAAAKASPADAEANVQEIVRQANVIARKGGGEMRLELRPEGMGQVHLKVSVQDGQVNVQMVAESNDAKKLLESSLHELKSGLSAHKLQLEALRVDAGDGVQKQMEQHNRDAQREAARQFAGDFMGGFREDREAFRQGFADRFPVRTYRGSPTAARVEESGRRDDGGRASSSRRLDLVA